MEVSIFSCFMSILCSSVMILLMYFFRKKWLLPNMLGVLSLLCLYFLCFLRMVIPIEFPFTKVLNVRGHISNILYSIIWKEWSTLNVTFVSILIIIMSMGSILLLIRFFYQYKKVMKIILSYVKIENEQYQEILGQVMERKKKIKVDVYFSEQLNIPIGIGVFKKSIILPNRDHSETELYYILLHEYTHFLNNDITIKMLVNIFCCIFWWNPIVYLLKKDLDQMLEIKCDLACTNVMQSDEKVEYLSTIVSTIKKATQKNQDINLYPTVALFHSDSNLTVLERFQIVYSNIGWSSKKKIPTMIWIVISIFLFLASYTIIPQTAYDVTREEVEEHSGAQEVIPSNAHIVRTSDGTYELVTKGGIYPIEQDMAIRMESEGFQIVEEKQ